ncbi:predicted protein [Thalassiosira pseudonana CCMP1335]|uniref:S1 motif domain-containing protein n=1 Tax=Thalassiosira pseudonana TaxID=35128 RepID=B8BU42_THAPS|nr:predicted protein [Thalassiosira pseudonana CCMP1335]EED94698.1 predicted protein [Thalassiosira pseudonana CCMP1335]|eukprot:g10487.t1 g10487   contig4:1963720-1965333(-)
MKFSASILAVAIAAPLSVSAFSTAFSRGAAKSAVSSTSVSRKSSTHFSSCACPSCITFHSRSCACSSCTGSHPANCACFSCSGGFALRMSEAVVEEVPVEVEALDGVASDEEAHNVDRPARASGIHKHKEGGKQRTALADLEIGASVEATVKTITAYGAFLDIGAKSDALVHVSRLSDDFVANVEDVVKAGEKITVRIVSVDTEKNQIAVTMRSEEAEASAARPTKRRERPQRSGADQTSQAASIKAISDKGFDDSKFIDGEVVSTLAFGAFVRFDSAQLGEGLEGEVDGLVHISALAEGRTANVSDVAAVGDKVSVRVRSVEPEAGRISLSMITKEQEEAAPPARTERRSGGGGREVAPIANSWKDTGAGDWKETMDEFTKDQPTFTNTAVIQDRRK